MTSAPLDSLPAPRGLDRWAVATALVVAVSVANHIGWILVDGRMPQDLGLYYTNMRSIFWGLAGQGDFPWSDVFAVGGWYNLLIAAVLRGAGRSAEAFRSLDVFWLLATLGLTAAIGRRLHGWRGAFVATALAASMPVLLVTGRMAWIHTPETSLVLAMTLAWLLDPRMERIATIAVHALCGGLVIWLRPSGLVWVASLVPFLAWGDGVVRPWRRLAVPVVAWAASGTPALLEMDNYLMAKAGARERYVLQVPDVLHQLHGILGMVPTYACLVLATLGLRRPFAPRLLFFAWAAGAVALWAIFRAGLDNFPLLAPGLALLAGGAALLVPRVATVGAALGLGIFVSSQWLPVQSAASGPSRFGILFGSRESQPGNYSRAWSGYGAAELGALLGAACSDDEPCTIVADQGLLFPYSEEPGQLELFLSRRKNVSLVDVRQGLPQVSRVDALVHFDCPERDPSFRQRFNRSEDAANRLVRGYGLAVAWGTQYGRACTVWWYTPGGRVPNPALLPPSEISATTRAR